MAGQKHHHIDKQKLLDYIEGKLTNEEAHFLEKMILEDPQYADALEGLESISSDDLKKDLAELEVRVTGKIDGKPNFWYRVAAAVSILVVASSILYITLNQFQQSSKEGTITLREEQDTEMAEPESAEPAEFLNDDAGDSNEKVAGANAIKDEAAPKPSPGTSPQPGKGIADQKTTRAEDELMDIDDKSEPVVENIVEEETTIEPEVSDPPDEYDFAETLAAPVTERSARVKRNAKVMDQPAMSAAATFEYADEAENIPGPVIGPDAFKQYLENSLVYPAYARQHNIQGMVELIFTVGADSIPRDIEVARSVGGGCDEEAIRILREGPKWVPLIENGKVVKEPVNLEILFRLK